MNKRIKLLSLSSGTTVTLLTIAGVLIVLGMFNDYLKWDIFGPKIEAVLYGIFGSSIALACIGVAMTIVLGTQEIVKAFQAIQRQSCAGELVEVPEVPRKMYVFCVLAGTLLLTLSISSLSFVNNVVQKHRSKVFKRLASEQMSHFHPKLSQLISPLSAPPRDNVSYDLYDLVKTLDNLSFVYRATIYLPDPIDDSAMWGYTAYREYKKEDGFARFFVAKDFEKAMAKGISGNTEPLDSLNEKTGFKWYYIVKDEKSKSIAVLRIDGNSRANFREYMLGS